MGIPSRMNEPIHGNSIFTRKPTYKGRVPTEALLISGAGDPPGGSWMVVVYIGWASLGVVIYRIRIIMEKLFQVDEILAVGGSPVTS